MVSSLTGWSEWMGELAQSLKRGGHESRVAHV